MTLKKLYLDISSGISGDMALALLLSLGCDSEKLSWVISKLINKKVELGTENCFRNGVLCSSLTIKTAKADEPFRQFTNIKKMILASEHLSENIKRKSIEAFLTIAGCESQIHSIPLDEVHFHEIGAVDTIIDIVGVAWCLEELGISEVVSSAAVCGHGTLKMCHGILPLPAPATLKILHGIPMKIIDVEGELTTPTGAAILKTFVDKYSDSVSCIIHQEAYSTGTLEFDGASNMLRGFIFSECEKQNHDEVTSITSNIDDMTGEEFGFLMDRLIKADGCLDVSYVPAFGKKNRPLYILNVLTKRDAENEIIQTIFKHSSTAGLRVNLEKRAVMGREFVNATVTGENIRVKRLFYGDVEKFYPEWGDCVKAAEKTDKTPREIYMKAVAKVNL